MKELRQMAERLKELERRPDEELLQDEANTIFGSLDPDFNLDASASVAEPQTPAPCSTRLTCLRRRVKREYTSSDEEDTESLIQSIVPNVPQTTITPAHKGQARLQQ
ncbi:uncharacterized protein LOC123226221 [Mangifera indica]|uniref:uncharacterized protein LOC123226221 n=1 Tax=Mangifera indica TaxID=29780 RepID=UPI001CFB9AF3|nr:uncharacterized protein LOC123226221 [Mangifera indica]